MKARKKLMVRESNRAERPRRARGRTRRNGFWGAVVIACLTSAVLLVPSAVCAQSPPDGRGYEMVSPLQKNNADAGTAKGAALFFSPVPRQAASQGDAVSYPAWTAFGPEAQSSPNTSQFLSRRTAGGWRTENLDPRFEEGFTRDPVVGLAPDLGHAALIVQQPALTPDADNGLWNIYARDNLAGTITAVTTQPPVPRISAPEYCVGFGGASTDFSHVFFSAKGALLPGDVAANGFNLYEWAPDQGLKLVSVLPDGTRAVPLRVTDFGGGSHTSKSDSCDPEESARRHAVSADGSRAFWTYGGTYQGAAEPLFAWSATGGTIQVDKPNEGITGAGGNGIYRDASADGTRLFFTDRYQLTADASPAGGEDLYLYDLGAPAGQRLTDLTSDPAEPAAVLGVVGASEDGEYVYFVARGSLTPSAEENGQAEHAESGKANLYVWHRGDGLRFIAQLGLSTHPAEPEDSGDWVSGGDFVSATARVAPSGRHLGFLSVRSLTGYDNTVRNDPTCHRNETGFFGEAECQEAYVYDYEANSLSCASCNPDGERPTAATLVPGWSTPYQGPRFLSDDGNRFFFETENALLPEDTNGRVDVYEWGAGGSPGCSVGDASYSPVDAGCIGLISTGTSTDDSRLVDASATGSDVFFTTRQPLSWEDEDEHVDVYDARVGGGFPRPPASPVCASGEQCHPPPAGLLPQGTAGTSRLGGGGNPQWSEPCSALRRSRGLAKRARRLKQKAKSLAAQGQDMRARSLREKARRLGKQSRRLRTTCNRNPR